MLAANAELEVRPRGPAAFGGEAHQLAHAFDVQRLERVVRQDAAVAIGAQEGAGVIAGNAEGGLRQVVGAEGEELRGGGDLGSPERGARQLDHRAGAVGERPARLFRHHRRRPVDHRPDAFELGAGRDQRHHDLGLGPGFGGGLEDRAGLHLVDFGPGDAKPATAVAEHRVGFFQAQRTAAQLHRIDAGGRGHFGGLLLGARQELVQRRVQKPDRHRQAVHDPEQVGEILPLHRQQLGERGAAPGLVVGQDHLTHGENAVRVEEHVLGAAEPDALGAEGARDLGVAGRLRIGAHPEPPHTVRPFHQPRETAGHLRLDRRDLARHHLPGASVDGDPVLGREGPPTREHDPVLDIDPDRARA